MERKIKTEAEYGNLLRSFNEASKLSLSFVLFPVLFLLIGVWLDKRFGTLPVFVLSGVVLGIIIFIYQVRMAIKNINKDKNISKSK